VHFLQHEPQLVTFVVDMWKLLSNAV
jgi:hypothetical protein